MFDVGVVNHLLDCRSLSGYGITSSMHEVVPRVVAMAVSTVITICRIFCQSSFFMFVMF